MTGVKTALMGFWAQFGVPAYLSDQVPPDAELPYITYDAAQGSITNAAVLTAYNWHKRQLGGNAERTEMLDRIAEAIPEGGVSIPVGAGYIILRRNAANFQTDWQDPEDADVIGGRTSYEVYFYLI